MIAVYNDEQEGIQWIGDGRAIYPLYNFPRLTRENIFRIMDIPEDKQDKINYQENKLPRDRFSFGNSDRAENMLDVGKIGIFTRGILFYPVKTQDGISFINSKNLTPFNDEENGYQLFERVTADGDIYIVVKTGFLLAGLVIPYSEVLTKDFAAGLIDIASATTAAAANRAYSEPEQISLEETEED